MWFDVQAALAEIQGAEKPGCEPGAGAIRAIRAIPDPAPPRKIARIARIARPHVQKLEITPGATDPETYLAHLHASGPTTYGAAATALGWGATRAWQAEARLRAAGLVRHGAYGLASPLKWAEHGKP